MSYQQKKFKRALYIIQELLAVMPAVSDKDIPAIQSAKRFLEDAKTGSTR